MNVRDLLSELAGRTGNNARRGRGARRPPRGASRRSRARSEGDARLRAADPSTFGQTPAGRRGPQRSSSRAGTRGASGAASTRAPSRGARSRQPGAGRKGDRATAAATTAVRARDRSPQRCLAHRRSSHQERTRGGSEGGLDSEITGWVVARPLAASWLRATLVITRREGGERGRRVHLETTAGRSSHDPPEHERISVHHSTAVRLRSRLRNTRERGGALAGAGRRVGRRPRERHRTLRERSARQPGADRQDGDRARRLHDALRTGTSPTRPSRSSWTSVSRRRRGASRRSSCSSPAPSVRLACQRVVVG